MQHLIVYAHPNPKSFCATICDQLTRLSQDLGNSVMVRDLYKINWNPVLSAKDFADIQKGTLPADIKNEQEFISEADLITLVFPLWWTGYPAILKGWVDRVLLNGFAYQHKAKQGIKPLLTGKKVQIITTMGASVDEYEKNGLMDAIAMTLGDNVWNFCGCDDGGMVVLGDVPGMSDKERMAVLSEIESSLVFAMASEGKKSPSKSSKKSSAKKTAKPKVTKPKQSKKATGSTSAKRPTKK